MPKRNPEKKVQVHQAFLTDGQRRRQQTRDWNHELRRIRDETTLLERKIDGVFFEPVEVGGEFLLGMHRPIDPSFMSQIDEDGASITDFLMDDEDSSNHWAQSSAVLFSDIDHVFALALGGQRAPMAGTLARFLEVYFPGREQEHWVIDPYMDRAQINRLQTSRGAYRFATKFSTQRDLFNANAPSSGVASYADDIAKAVGQDIEIEIVVKLPRESRGRQATKKFLDLIRSDLHRTVHPGSGAKATAVIDDELQEELSLVAHRMAATFDLPNVGTERRQFGDLLRGLKDVSGELNTRIRELEEG